MSFRIGLFSWFMVYSNPDDSQISESKVLFSRYIICWRRDPTELNIHLNTHTCTHMCTHTGSFLVSEEVDMTEFNDTHY